MTKLCTLLLISILSSGNAQTPIFEWALSSGGEGYDRGNSITHLDNFTYLTGDFNGVVDFDPSEDSAMLISKGKQDIFIAKYDSVGNLCWVKGLGGVGDDRAKKIKIDNKGNIIVAGIFQDTVAFDSTNQSFTFISHGRADIFFMNLSTDGQIKWVKNIGGAGSDQVGNLILNNSNIYMTGDFGDTVDFDPSINIFNLSSKGNNDVFLAKYDSLGNLKWAISNGSKGLDRGRDIDVDRASNIYVTGHFRDTIDFDPSIKTNLLISKGYGDSFLAKYDSNGVYQWAQSTGNEESDNQELIAVDQNGNIYMTGHFRGTVDFNPSPDTNFLTTNDYQDSFLAKYSSDGKFLWANNFGSGAGYETKILDDNKIAVVGYCTDTVDFDPSANTNFLFAGGTSKMFIAFYDSLGDFISVYGTRGYIFPFDCFIKNDDLFITGIFEEESSISFSDPDEVVNSFGQMDFFISKHNIVVIETCEDGFINGDEDGVDCGGTKCPPCIFDGVNLHLHDVYSINPNPASEVISIRGNGSINIINSSGRVIYEGHVLVQAIIDISKYSTGVYVVKIMNDMKIEYHQLIIN